MRILETNRVDVVAFSGGKDSTATLLHAIERRDQGFLEDFRVVFADTGNEHSITYEYLDYIERMLCEPIIRVKADFADRMASKREYIKKHWHKELKVTRWGKPRVRRPLREEEIEEALTVIQPTGNPMLDLFLQKGMMPTPRQKFCSMELKQIPVFQQIYKPILDDGNVPICWQGVRAQESPARSRYEPAEITGDGLVLYRPLLLWTHEDVFRIAKRHKIKPNPLYEQGMTRVGCMPCINCSSRELAEIGRRFPEEINRIAEWENLLSKATRSPESRDNGVLSFFPFKARPEHLEQGLDIHTAVKEASENKAFKTWQNDEWYQDDADPDVCSAVYPIVCE